jgi:hypothetical protein
MATFLEVGDAADEVQAIRRASRHVLDEAHDVTVLGRRLDDHRVDVRLPELAYRFEATLTHTRSYSPLEPTRGQTVIGLFRPTFETFVTVSLNFALLRAAG